MMAFVRLDGCDLYYEEVGQGVPILLIHPAGATAATWGAATEELARIGRVITYDRRGYARSGGEPVRSVSTHTADAAAMLESLGTPPAIVVGTSAGAIIATDLAVRRPDLVRAVIEHEGHGGSPVTFLRVRRSRRSPRSDRSFSAAARATPPRRCCGPPTATVTVEPRGTPFPRRGGGPAGRTRGPPCGTSSSRLATIHPRWSWRPSGSPSCAATALGAPTSSSAARARSPLPSPLRGRIGSKGLATPPPSMHQPTSCS